MIDPAAYRAEVLALRIALERAAVGAFAHACQPSGPTPQSYIRLRLLFLVTLVPPDDAARARRLARLGGHVYKLTSDVLHGRLRAVVLDDRVLDEWRVVVAEIQSLVESASTCRRAEYLRDQPVPRVRTREELLTATDRAQAGMADVSGIDEAIDRYRDGDPD